VSRWRRYGKDRLYVTGDDGARLGYRDLLTGQDHVEQPDRLGEFHAALGDWAPAEVSLVAADLVDRRDAPPVGSVADEGWVSGGQIVAPELPPSEDPAPTAEPTADQAAPAPAAPSSGTEKAGRHAAECGISGDAMSPEKSEVARGRIGG
jgi:hypothetical protein